MAFAIQHKKGISIKRVVTKIAITVLTLYVGGTILNNIGTVMNGTCSPFYPGLTLIGWTVGQVGNLSQVTNGCTSTTTITSTSGSGILTVVGLIGMASIIMEFVEFSF